MLDLMHILCVSELFLQLVQLIFVSEQIFILCKELLKFCT